ncbi:MAG: hypothetical protein PF689_03060 [Deltaproteobacteria bacterium]|nr:hypothetical protein [Deltaproteobacteria bacterium]
MDKSEMDIREGTISFWVQPGNIVFNDNKVTPLVELNPKNGSIFMVKDSDNKLKFFHVYLGKGRTDVEYDVTSLDPAIKHMFAVTWSLKNERIVMYVDGKSVSEAAINYSYP